MNISIFLTSMDSNTNFWYKIKQNSVQISFGKLMFENTGIQHFVGSFTKFHFWVIFIQFSVKGLKVILRLTRHIAVV